MVLCTGADDISVFGALCKGMVAHGTIARTVNRGRDGNRSGGPRIDVAQRERERLKSIRPRKKLITSPVNT